MTPWVLTLDLKLLLTTQNVLRAFSYCTGTCPFEGCLLQFYNIQGEKWSLNTPENSSPCLCFCSVSGWSVLWKLLPIKTSQHKPSRQREQRVKITIQWSNSNIWCPLCLFLSPFSDTRHQAWFYSIFSQLNPLSLIQRSVEKLRAIFKVWIKQRWIKKTEGLQVLLYLGADPNF